MANAAPAVPLLSAESAALALQLQILRLTPLELARLTDAATLAYQIAHVDERHGRDRTRVVLLLRALQQLTRVAHTNPLAWKELVTWLWPEEARALLRVHERAGAGNGAGVVGLSIGTDGPAALASVHDLLLASDDSTNDAEADDSETALLPPLAVPLTFKLLFMGRALGTTLSTVTALAEPPLPSRARSRCFCVKRIMISMPEVDDVLWLDQFTALAARGVALDQFPHLNIEITKRNAALIVRNLQRLLATRGPRGQDLDQSKQTVSSFVQRVKLAPRPDNVYSHVLAMLISATGNSSTVREVVAYPNRRNSIVFAQWLAYALFSREANHAIRSFSLEMSPRTVFAHEDVKDVLQADDPVAVLFPALADSVTKHAHTRLSAARFVLYDPDDAANAAGDDYANCAELTTHPHSELRILSRSSAWWSVVLPAWGRAWVRHGDATITTIDAANEARRRRHTIPELSLLMVTTDDMAQTLSWLALVDSGARTVSLSQYDREPTSMILDWTAAKAAFPNATTLHLTNLQVDEPGAFAASIASGSWRLEHLRLTNLTPTTIGIGVETFLERFADATTSQHFTPTALQSLTIVATNQDTPRAAIMAAALRLLSVDRYIESFRLTLKRRRGDDAADEDKAAMRMAFAAHHGTPLHTRLREKLALLSAAAHYDSGLLQQLDRNIVAEIFCFAGWCPRRTVKLVV